MDHFRTYMDTVSYAPGCGTDSIFTVNLTIHTLDTSVTQVSSTELEADLAGANYQWLDCENSLAPISGATNRSFSPASNGAYAVAVTLGTCSETETSACHSITSAGIKKKYRFAARLHPNPVQKEKKVTVQLGTHYQKVRGTLMTPTGQTLSTKTVEHTQSFQMEVDGQQGLYLLKLQSPKGRQRVLKFVKK